MHCQYTLILGGAKIYEFGWVNYGLNNSEIESTIRQILNYIFKQEMKIIFTAASIFEPLEYEAWKQRCRYLFLTFFSRGGKFSGIITFPDSLTGQGKPWDEVTNTLKNWCANSNSGSDGDPTGLIIRNYDLQNHLAFCGIVDDEIKASLIFKSLEKK